MGGGIGDFFEGAVDTVSDAVTGAGDWLGDMGSSVGDFVKNIPTELGNAWEGINDLGLDNMLATLGTVVPGPWTPAAIAYNVGDSALSGNYVDAALNAIPGFGGMGGGGELPGLSSLFDQGSAVADLASTVQNATPFAETTGDWFKPVTQSFETAGGSDLLTKLAGQGAQQSQNVLQGLGLGTKRGGMSSMFDLVSSNPANMGSTWGLGDLWDKVGGMSGIGKIASPILKGVGGILGAQEASQNKSQLQDMMNQMQNRNQFYNQQLQQTYQNPQAYLASPEAQALRSAAGQKIAREDARTGRRGQYVAAMNQLNQQMLGNLGNYRKGLAGLVGPQYDQQQLALQRALMSQSPTGNFMAGLGSIFGK